MSRPVALADLAHALDDLVPSAYLCTVSEDGRPKVAHVPVRAQGDVLLVEVGPGTVRNIVDRPAATLIWPGTEDQSMSLLVDAMATETAVDGVVQLDPTSAVWHRPAPPPTQIA